MDNFNNIIKEICKEKEIKLNIVSDGWVKILEKDNKIRYINQFYFDNNKSATARILDEKYCLYETLKFWNIPVVKHHLLYAFTPEEEVMNLFHKYNNSVVVKTNTGSRGIGVYWAKTEDELKDKLNTLFQNNYSISLSPYYDVYMEYRIILLNGNAELIYGKIRPIVTGDGKTSIKDLLIKFNSHYFSQKQNLSEDILPKNETYAYNWQFNLSKGAMSTMNIPKSKQEKLKKIAKMVYDKLNIAFCSIDIIETNGELMVLEINSGIAINKFTYQHEKGHEIAVKIYGKAIDSLFDE